MKTLFTSAIISRTLVSVILLLRMIESVKRQVEACEDCPMFLTSSECNAQIPRGSELGG